MEGKSDHDKKMEEFEAERKRLEEKRRKEEEQRERESTNVKDIVILVTDKKEARYGQIAKLRAHDFTEYGMYHVKFKDGEFAKYPDGLCVGDKPSPVRKFYRGKDKVKEAEWKKHNNTIANLKATFLELDVGSIERLKSDYRELFGEELPG